MVKDLDNENNNFIDTLLNILDLISYSPKTDLYFKLLQEILELIQIITTFDKEILSHLNQSINIL